jgi:hypothetical protein
MGDSPVSSGFLRGSIAWAAAVCAFILVPAAACASDQLSGPPGGGITMAPDGDEFSSEPGPDDEKSVGSGGGDWFTSVDGVAIATILLALGLALGHRRAKRRKPLWRSGRDPPPCPLGECHHHERPDTGRFNGHDAPPVTAALESPRLSFHIHLQDAHPRAFGRACATARTAPVTTHGGFQQ